MINVRLSTYLEKENKISKIQSSFRRNNGTTDNLINVETLLREAISPNLQTIVVYSDLYKAFGSKSKHFIVRKLHDYGIRGELLYFINTFLNDT